MGTSYSSGVGGQESDTIVTQEEIEHLATMTWGDIVWHDELGRGEILDLCTFTTWAKVRFASGDHIIHDVTTLRHHVDSSTCDLYRFYDAAGTLLYVGISLHAAVRSSQHRRDKPWWPLAARMEIEHLPNRDEALMAERRVIWTERPLHNVVNANDQPIETFTLPPEAERWGSDTGFVSYGQHRPAREQVVVPKCGHCGRKHKHGVLPHELERGWMDRYPHCSGLFAVDNVPWQRIYFPVKEAR